MLRNDAPYYRPVLNNIPFVGDSCMFNGWTLAMGATGVNYFLRFPGDALFAPSSELIIWYRTRSRSTPPNRMWDVSSIPVPEFFALTDCLD